MPKAPLIVLVAAWLASCGPNRPAPVSTAPAPAPVVESPPPTKPAPERLVLTKAGASALLCRVLSERDEDCDLRITTDDERRCSLDPKACAAASASRFPYSVQAGDDTLEVHSVHEVSQLVQELILGLREPERASIVLDAARVRADPASYLAYRISTHHWDGLTRTIDGDEERLTQAAKDEKVGKGANRPLELCSAHENRCARGRSKAAAQQAALPERSGEFHVYFPESDEQARRVFEKAAVPGLIAVHPLPRKPTPAWVLETTRAKRHGLLTLALDANGRGRPFVVPGGRFNEMYGWDSFFIAWGLVQDPERIELARSIADNQVYELTHYGKILNANRTYYLTRSQPPFLTSLISEVHPRLTDTADRRRWLETVLPAAIREYRTVWNAPPRRLQLCEGDVCLARYFGEGRGEPPEVEPSHFDWFYQKHAVSHGHCTPPGPDQESRARFLACAAELGEQYRSGKLADRPMDEFFVNDRCVRESGHDTSFRWFDESGERCTDFATVDLNSLLFKYEVDIATLLARELGGTLRGDDSKAFCARAAARARLIEKYLWDAETGLFLDYDIKHRRRSKYLSATTLYPLWASAPNACNLTLVTPEMAHKLRDGALRELEAPGGLLATGKNARAGRPTPTVLQRGADGSIQAVEQGRQWEAPNGWAPHQMLAWTGLSRANFDADAQRLAYRWLYTIVKNAASFHGTVPEKFDVVLRSHAVFQEYGNVNTEFSYIAEEGFGWMNASFVVGYALLRPELRDALKRLISPEQLFATAP